MKILGFDEKKEGEMKIIEFPGVVIYKILMVKSEKLLEIILEKSVNPDEELKLQRKDMTILEEIKIRLLTEYYFDTENFEKLNLNAMKIQMSYKRKLSHGSSNIYKGSPMARNSRFKINEEFHLNKNFLNEKNPISKVKFVESNVYIENQKEHEKNLFTNESEINNEKENKIENISKFADNGSKINESQNKIFNEKESLINENESKFNENEKKSNENEIKFYERKINELENEEENKIKKNNHSNKSSVSNFEISEEINY